MRLTRLLTDEEIKLGNDYSISEEIKRKKGDFTICDNARPFELENKLGQLEDIEEELGIDLVKLLSAKKVYYMVLEWKKENENI